MAGYLPHHQKKDRIFNKREKELVHAIKNEYSKEKLVKAAEKLREAKLGVFKSRFSQKSVLPAECFAGNEKSRKWEQMDVEEIIEMYLRK